MIRIRLFLGAFFLGCDLLHLFVAHGERLVLEHFEKNDDLGAAVAELERVAQEVGDHLDETVLVAVDGVVVHGLARVHGRKDQRHVLLFGHVLDDAEDLLDGGMDGEVGLVELEGVVLHLRQVQEVHHQVAHDLTTEDHHFDGLHPLRHE